MLIDWLRVADWLLSVLLSIAAAMVGTFLLVSAVLFVEVLTDRWR